MTTKPFLWNDQLLAMRMKATLVEKRSLVEALDRHLAFVYKRRLFTLRQFSKVS